MGPLPGGMGESPDMAAGPTTARPRVRRARRSDDPLAEAPILAAFPSARLNDLWALQDAAFAALPRVRCPVLVAVAEQDHVVDPDGGRLLVQRLSRAPRVRFIQLKQGFHIIPRDAAGPLLSQEVGSFFGRLR